jgi:hypothetical protein
MRAGSRFGIAAMAAALALASISAPALAQEAAPADNTIEAAPPPADTIGPRELQNFSINGTVTRPAPEAPSDTTPATGAAQPAPTTAQPGATPGQPGAPAPERSASRSTRAPAATTSSATTALPPSDALTDPQTAAPAGDLAQPGFEPAAPSGDLSAGHRTNFVPWLLALLLLGGAAGYYFWRQRSRPSYAAAGVRQAYAAPDPAPAPQPRQPAPTPQPVQRAPAPQPLQRAPAPQPFQPSITPRPDPVPQAAPLGVVATRLRPWLEIEFSPGRCVVEDDKATIQFDIAVFNSGSAPARDVLIEASMFNAGPAQDQEIGAFFAHPVAKGDRIPAIPPLKRVAIKSAVSLTTEQMRQFEVAGKRIFVPLIGFNALYRWSGGDGQTSASYLVGRDTQGEKMAPLRLDLGPRIFRGLGARQHNLGVRI